MTVIYVLLVAHFVADFLCQSDWMALNKSKRVDALAQHVVVYSVVIFTLTPWGLIALGVYGKGGSMSSVLTWIGVNAAAHFVQDAITSRITSRLWFINMLTLEVKDTRHWFFVAIGADQLLHYLTLFVTADWWLR